MNERQSVQEKKKYLDQLTNRMVLSGSWAIDQRGALKKMIGNYKEATTDDVIKFKELVSQQLTPYASAILLDPEYGLPAAEVRDAECGLLLAYEKLATMRQHRALA